MPQVQEELQLQHTQARYIILYIREAVHKSQHVRLLGSCKDRATVPCSSAGPATETPQREPFPASAPAQPSRSHGGAIPGGGGGVHGTRTLSVPTASVGVPGHQGIPPTPDPGNRRRVPAEPRLPAGP